MVFRYQEGKELVSGSWEWGVVMSYTVKEPKIHANGQTWDGGALFIHSVLEENPPAHTGCFFSVQLLGCPQIKSISQLPEKQKF